MSRTKNTEKDPYLSLDKLPKEVKILDYLRQRLDTPAMYYRFEKIEATAIDDAKHYTPLAKAGMLDEISPVFLKTKRGADIALVLSGAFAALRVYVQHKLDDEAASTKLLFSGDTFYALPDQPTQIGQQTEWTVTLIGDESPVTEAEIIQIMWKAFEEMGIQESLIEFRVNAIGCSNCRTAFRSAFNAFLRNKAGKLCKQCKQQHRKMPTQILHCADEKCKIIAASAPQILDFLCEGCKKHFKGVLEFLDESAIPYVLDVTLFKEGSWFNNIAFEFRKKVSDDAPSPGELSEDPKIHLLAEGGRISRAAKLIHGKRIEAVCGTVFLRNVAAVLESSDHFRVGEERTSSVFLIQLGELAKRKSLNILEMLRSNQIEVFESLGRDSIRAQFKAAERAGAKVALVIGQKEALDKTVIVREITSGIQETIPQQKLIEFLQKRMESWSK